MVIFKENWLSLSDENKQLIATMEEKYPEMTSEFKQLCMEQYLMFLRKQSDYGPGNISLGTKLESAEEKRISLSGIVIRLNDKINRLITLVLKKSTPKNESIQDSFMDSSIYSKIALIVMKDKWAK